MAGRSVPAIVVSFVVAGLMLSQVHGIYEEEFADLPDYNSIATTTVQVNGSFFIISKDLNSVTECKVIPPGSSSTPTLDLKNSRDLRESYRIQHLGRSERACGFLLYPVRKTDEGIWEIQYSYYRTNYGSHIGSLKTARLIVKEPDAPDEIDGKVGQKVEFHLSLRSRLPSNNLALSSCVAIHPNGTEITISPSTPNEKSRIKYSPGPDDKGFGDGYCNVLVEDILVEDNGNWTVKVNTSSGLSFKRDIILFVKVNTSSAVVIPDEIVVNKHEEISFQLKMLESKTKVLWDSCSVTAPNGTLYHLNGVALDGSNTSHFIVYEGRGLQKGDCGAKFEQVQPDMGGRWIFTARVSGNKQLITATTIIHISADEKSNNHTVVYGTVGKVSKLTCGPVSALQCALVSPTGERQDFDGPCTLNITIRKRDIGQWNCSALLPSSWNEMFFTTTLIYVWPVDMAVDTTETLSEVTLICKPRQRQNNFCESKPKSCILEKPTGERILLREGVTTTGSMQRYKLTGDGISQCDCSISIQKPLIEAEYGQWRCIMKYADHIDGGFINVKRADGSNDSIPEASLAVRKHPENGIVRSGDQISIECRANRPLDYCSLRSPSGKIYIYNSFPINTQESVVLFKGFGLSLGECGFQFKSANPQMHSGKWTIEVGLMKDNSTTLEQEIDVDFKVTDPNLSAKNSIVNASPGDSALLECIITSGDKQLDFCIFQMPNGSSLRITNDSKNGRITQYGAGFNRGECGIQINHVLDEDFGQWTCIVQLRDRDRRTQSAFILLRHQTSSMTKLEKSVTTSLKPQGSVAAFDTSVTRTETQNLPESRTNQYTCLMPNGTITITGGNGSLGTFTSGLCLGVLVTIALGYITYRFTRHNFFFRRHQLQDRVLNNADSVELS